MVLGRAIESDGSWRSVDEWLLKGCVGIVQCSEYRSEGACWRQVASGAQY